MPAVSIGLPDGSVVSSADRDVDGALSSFLGRKVTLTSVVPDAAIFEEYWPDIDDLAPAEFIEQTRTPQEQPGEAVSDIALGLAAPKGTFYDLAVLHVITTATLEQLGALYPEGRFDVHRYRPNVLIETLAAGFVENEWPGRTLGFGADVQAPVSLPTMRCVMTTLARARPPGRSRAVAHDRAAQPRRDRRPRALGLCGCLRGGERRRLRERGRRRHAALLGEAARGKNEGRR